MVLGQPEHMLTGSGHRAAVLGSPISHSLSPALHHAAYRALGLSDWLYDAHEVQADALAEFVAGLGEQWGGLSLTMPLKEVAFEVVDEVSDLAREVGAINTLIRRADGGWRGENSDVYGVWQALREAGCPQVTSSLVLGSGATARSVVAALVAMGCAMVTFAVRSEPRQATLEQARRAGLEVAVVRLGQLADVLDDAPLVVSTLPANTLPANTLPSAFLPGSALPARGSSKGSQAADRLLLDVVYSGWPTPLARVFQRSGVPVVSGLEILVHQAAEQVYLMTGQRPPVQEMRAAGLAAMSSR